MLRTTPLDPLLKDLDILERPFDLTAGIGVELSRIATEEILASMDAEESPDGFPWPPLNAYYEAWKQTVAPGEPMGVLYGVMKTTIQIEGVQLATPDRRTQTYGTDTLARIEAEKFQEGGAVTGTNQPGREFYGLSGTAYARMSQATDREFASLTIP